MASGPEFSVVIPTYNRAGVIRHTLDSVLAQTFDDFEVVVIDDGSKDDLASVIATFEDPRIRYVWQENGGGGAARNRGIDEARGRYVAFLDSDDVFLPDHLSVMHQLLGGRGDVVAYAQVIVDRQSGKTFLKPPRAIGEKEDMAEYLCCSRGFVQTSTLVVPTPLARRVRYRDRMPFGQDTDFAIRLAREGCRFVMAPQPGAIWNDAFDPRRVSAARKGAQLLPWIEEMKPIISTKAYHGYRGWHIAKGVAKTSKTRALMLYLTALMHFCYTPLLAGVVFFQIFVPDGLYRRFSDVVVQLIGSRKKQQA
ncbi:glycosyltransferase family 2 protein [Labrys okinawensis]|uniref:glycosyltransferase family 2 protein n=1 Tax=Labrys okinawensis TaxID=346911 RepID=UPI0039BC5B01